MNDEEKHPKRKEAFYSLGSNVLLAILKFAAAEFTGSSVLFSEGVHSIVNAADAVSMLVGRRHSMRPVDESHPFGHGKELYFWTLIVGVTIFAVASTLIFFESFFQDIIARAYA